MRRIKKVISVVFSIVLIVSLVSTNVSAAFYTKTIKNSSDMTSILNLVKSNDGDSRYEKIKYIFYNSQFAAATNGKFPYLNSGSSYNYVIDNGVKYTLSGYSRGCYLYADYVSQYVYGISSHSNKCVTVKINNNAGSMTAAQVQNAITLYAQAGEHIRIDNTHSIAFVAYDNNGFYYTSYATDSDPKIYVRYTTWSNFANECNGYSKIAMIYDIDRSTNTTSSTVTVLNASEYKNNEYYETNAILNGQVNKPSSYPVTKLGIRIRKTSGSYSDSSAKFYKHTPTGHSNSYVGELKVYTWFDINTELNMKLTHGTSYTYQIYAVVNGEEYFSHEKTFSTTGSHSYGSWATTKAATCTESGIKKRTCSCGAYETSSISASGHNWSNTFTVDKVATCISKGSKSRHCLNCNAKTDVTEYTTTLHSLCCLGTVSEATCTESAKEKWFCDDCKQEFIVSDPDNRPALGHNWSIATCTKAKTCDRCGVTEGSALGHKYTNNADTTCNDCGATSYPGGNTLVQEGGKWYHVINRKKVKDTTLVKYNGTWYYVNAGRVDFASNTLVKYNNQWYHVNGGKWVKDTTLVQYNGTWYYVKDGRVDFSGNTLVKYNNEWWYVKGGKLCRDNTLHKFTDGKWYHVNNGKWVKDTTLVQYNGSWYYVKGGKVDFASNTLVKYNGTWYYVKGGRVDFTYTGNVKYNGKTYKVVKGKLS